jgi:hypothetical protein
MPWKECNCMVKRLYVVRNGSVSRLAGLLLVFGDNVRIVQADINGP